MAIKEIIQPGHPRLRGIAERVNEPASVEIASLIEDLRDTLANSRAGTGYGRGSPRHNGNFAAGHFSAASRQSTVAAAESGNHLGKAPRRLWCGMPA
jgi:hypothetical protein